MDICVKMIENKDLDAFKEFSAATLDSAVSFALAARRRKTLKKLSGSGFWQHQKQATPPKLEIVMT